MSWALALDDLDRDHDLVHVVGKGRRPRAVPFGAKTGQAIDRYVRARRQHPQATSPAVAVQGHVLGGLDRGIRIARVRDDGKHVERWQAAADTMKAEILHKGVDDRKVFTQHYETKDLDASNLLIAILGFLPGEEGTFTICSFWIVSALAIIGETARARALFEKLLSFAGPLHLYARGDRRRHRHLGNFPQAFTHLALIDAGLRRIAAEAVAAAQA